MSYADFDQIPEDKQDALNKVLKEKFPMRCIICWLGDEDTKRNRKGRTRDIAIRTARGRLTRQFDALAVELRYRKGDMFTDDYVEKWASWGWRRSRRAS